VSGGAKKGSPFERAIAKQLSLWWTGGERDDVIWRTQASGGRATIRSKAGRTLHGQYGDLTFTDPVAKPLFDVFMIECKRGYGKWSLLDELDNRLMKKQHTLGKWLTKANVDLLASKAQHFLIIAQRDMHVPIVIMRTSTRSLLCDYVGPTRSCLPELVFHSSGRQLRDVTSVIAMRLNDVLEWVTPAAIRFMAASEEDEGSAIIPQRPRRRAVINGG